MKLKLNNIKSYFLPVVLILGAILLINMLFPCLLKKTEGFQEGNTSKTTLAGRNCIQAQEKCEKNIRDHILSKIDQSIKEKNNNKHFKDGQITTAFNDYVKTDKINISQNTNCKDFAACKFTEKLASSPTQSAAPAPPPVSAPAPAPSTATSSSTTQPTNEQILQAINNLQNTISSTSPK